MWLFEVVVRAEVVRMSCVTMLLMREERMFGLAGKVQVWGTFLVLLPVVWFGGCFMSEGRGLAL